MRRRAIERPQDALTTSRTRGPGQRQKTPSTTDDIVRELDGLCIDSVHLAIQLAARAQDRRDATSARLATDALSLAVAAHDLQDLLAGALESGVTL